MRSLLLMLVSWSLAAPAWAGGPFLGYHRVAPPRAQTTPGGPVEIDVEPWSHEDVVELGDGRPLSVAVLGSPSLDVRDVDAGSLSFGPEAAEPAVPERVLRVFRSDVNADGFEDLAVPFWKEETGLAVGDTSACLSGVAGGSAFSSCSGLTVRFHVSCGLGPELALVLPPLLSWRGRRRR